IYNQIEAIYSEWGGDPKIRLKDLISALTSEGRQPVTAILTLEGDPKQGSSVDNNKMLKQDALVVVDGMAVFRQAKMIGTLTLHDVQNYLWTQNILQDASIGVPCSTGKYFGLRIYNTRTRIKAHYQGHTPQIELQIHIESFLTGTQCDYDVEKIETFKKLESLANRSIETRILSTIQKVQKQYGVDIFGFGEDMYRQDTEAFKKVRDHWHDEFKKAKVVVHADMKIRRTGIRTRSFLNEMK
ncbi:MAG: Ger(x)C family spore germination C-terminal domain-containing protein, partial [Tumebacillaceae bacterium]